MGKFALLAVAFATIVVMQTRHLDHDGSARAASTATFDETVEVLARSNALAGFARLEQALTSSFEDVTVTGAFEGGAYQADAVVTGNQARITTVGTFPRTGRSDMTYRIRALVEFAGGPAATGSPAFLDYSVLAGGDLMVGGTADVVRSGVTDSTHAPLVHTNRNVMINGSAARVLGFGTHTGTLTGDHASTFVPPYNPEGQPPTQYADAVEIPPLDPDLMASAFATVVDHYPTTLGGPAFTDAGGVIPGGTRDNPTVYRVHGDLSLSNSHVDGYALFIVEGNATIKGAVTSSGGAESTLGIYTTGSVAIGGNSSAQAQIFSEGALTYGGTVDIYGSVVTRSSINLDGTMKVHSVPASPALAGAWPTGGRGLMVLAYAEH